MEIWSGEWSLETPGRTHIPVFTAVHVDAVAAYCIIQKNIRSHDRCHCLLLRFVTLHSTSQRISSPSISPVYVPTTMPISTYRSDLSVTGFSTLRSHQSIFCHAYRLRSVHVQETGTSIRGSASSATSVDPVMSWTCPMFQSRI